MKKLLVLCAIIVSLSSCGNQIYGYRKTVKVKSTEASVKKYNGATKAYFTVEAKPAVTPTAPIMDVNPNTLHLTTKPVPEKKKEASTEPSSSAMVR